jgi:hypothetical protein
LCGRDRSLRAARVATTSATGSGPSVGALVQCRRSPVRPLTNRRECHFGHEMRPLLGAHRSRARCRLTRGGRSGQPGRPSPGSCPIALPNVVLIAESGPSTRVPGHSSTRCPTAQLMNAPLGADDRRDILASLADETAKLAPIVLECEAGGRRGAAGHGWPLLVRDAAAGVMHDGYQPSWLDRTSPLSTSMPCRPPAARSGFFPPSSDVDCAGAGTATSAPVTRVAGALRFSRCRCTVTAHTDWQRERKPIAISLDDDPGAARWCPPRSQPPLGAPGCPVVRRSCASPESPTAVL